MMTYLIENWEGMGGREGRREEERERERERERGKASVFTYSFVVLTDAVQQNHHPSDVHQAGLPSCVQCHHLGQTGNIEMCSVI